MLAFEAESDNSSMDALTGRSQSTKLRSVEFGFFILCVFFGGEVEAKFKECLNAHRLLFGWERRFRGDAN